MRTTSMEETLESGCTVTEESPALPGQWQVAYAVPRRRWWTWQSFAAGSVAGIISGIIGLFALGAVLFEDDIATDLEADKDRNASYQWTQAQVVPSEARDAIQSTMTCTGVACVGINKVRLDSIESYLAGVAPRQASVDLSYAYGDWYRAHRIWTSQWCQHESRLTESPCAQAVREMNEALQIMAQLMPHS